VLDDDIREREDGRLNPVSSPHQSASNNPPLKQMQDIGGLFLSPTPIKIIYWGSGNCEFVELFNYHSYLDKTLTTIARNLYSPPNRPL